MSLSLIREKSESLYRFPLTEKQAVFLSLIAHYSGYFTSDQYQRFSGTTKQNASSFLNKLKKANFVKSYSYENGKRAYHLFSKSIYKVLGLLDNRHRRRHEIIYIKSKLMGLDFILSHLDLNFLATEQDRIHFFSSLNIPEETLPVKRYKSPTSDKITHRYFVDKYPIFTADNGGGFVVSFCYIDPVLYTTSGHFKTHLENYRNLFQQLKNFRLIYVSHDEFNIQTGKKIFEEFSSTLISGGKISSVSVSPDMMDYFQIKRDIELEKYEKITGERAGKYRLYLEKYASSDVQILYEKWMKAGTDEVENTAVDSGHFDSVLLPNRYRFLGGFCG